MAALYFESNPTFTLDKGATITSTMSGEENGYALYVSGGATIKGKGSIKAENKTQQVGAQIYGTFNLEGGSFEAIGGSTAYGMYIGGTLTLNKTFTQLKVTSGQTTDPICIYKSATGKEATLAELIGGGAEADFVDSGVKDGVRTITPKPAEE